MRLRPAIAPVAILLAALAASAAARAEDGRDFAAFYDPQNPIEVGEDVVLTFVAEIFNHSGEAIVGATVAVRGVLFLQEVYATFPAVEIPAGGSVRLSREVTVASREYEAWLGGSAPFLTIEFQDSAAESRLDVAQTMQFALPEEPSS